LGTSLKLVPALNTSLLPNVNPRGRDGQTELTCAADYTPVLYIWTVGHPSP